TVNALLFRCALAAVAASILGCGAASSGPMDAAGGGDAGSGDGSARSDGGGSSDAGPGPAHFSTLPPGSALPSDWDCAQWVRRSSFEPRTDNAAANNLVPTVNQLATYHAT